MQITLSYGPSVLVPVGVSAGTVQVSTPRQVTSWSTFVHAEGPGGRIWVSAVPTSHTTAGSPGVSTAVAAAESTISPSAYLVGIDVGAADDSTELGWYSPAPAFAVASGGGG